MKPSRVFVSAIPLVVATWLVACGQQNEAKQSALSLPSFEVDPNWPGPLPNGWIWASVLGLFVDDSDHVWVSHRAELVPPDQIQPSNPCCVRAPLVIEFDAAAQVFQTWGEHDRAHEWPSVLHGFFVDHQGFVWTAAREQQQVMKFTRDGDAVLTIGRFDETGGSADTMRLGRPADVYVDPASNELFVVDGYTNRRVIVFDAETGAYRRHWGAYGDQPIDQEQPPAGELGSPPARGFALVHSITGSRDGLLYIADQNNSRIQVFTRDGVFVTERVLRSGAGAATAVTLSRDPEQQFVYVADGSEHKIRILRRLGLEVLGVLGGPGTEPGLFGRPHNLAVDSKGNLYVAEADPGRRVQKFIYRGTSSP